MKQGPGKWMITSAAFHITFAALILLAPGFSSRKDETIEVATLDLIPTRAVDQDFNRLTASPQSRQPNVPAAEPPPASRSEPPPRTPVQPAPPKPSPQRQEIKVAPEPQTPPEAVAPKVKVAAEPVGRLKLAPTKDGDEPSSGASTKPGRKEIQVSSQPVKGARKKPAPSEDESDTKARAEAARAEAAWERARQEASENRRKAAERLMGRLEKGLSTSTEVSMPGPGGESYASYKSILKTLYQRAWESRKPTSVSADRAVVSAAVTIARDGTVVSTKVLNPSGVSSVDRSIDRVLRDVNKVPAFPEGSMDNERTFQISFIVDGDSSL